MYNSIIPPKPGAAYAHQNYTDVIFITWKNSADLVIECCVPKYILIPIRDTYWEFFIQNVLR